MKVLFSSDWQVGVESLPTCQKMVEEILSLKAEIGFSVLVHCGDVKMREIWKLIFDGDYELSNLGRDRRLKPSRGARVGYIRESVVENRYVDRSFGKDKNGVVRRAYLHVLVAKEFIGPCPKGKEEVNHKDGVKSNNKWTNLEYVTHKENQEHASRNALMATGERVGSSKLSIGEVRAIRKRARVGLKAHLAKEFGVCLQTICNIVNKKTWK